MFLSDALQMGKPRMTKEGYMAVRAKAARTGVQDYLGVEIDPTGQNFKPDEIVPVYRPEDEVFSKDSVHSFLMKPITNNHPKEPVTAENWKDHSGGIIAKAMRDGDDLAFDLILMDKSIISDVKSGKRELSNGYAAELVIEDGFTSDGKPYKVKQVGIRGNHIAVVDRGRAGNEYRILDSIGLCDANASIMEDLNKTETLTMKITIGDAKAVDLGDSAAVAVAVGELNTTLADAQSKVGELTVKIADANTLIETKDGEIAALKAKLADAEVTPEKLQALADARAKVIADAKKIAPSLVADGKTDEAIRKEAVVAKLGDAAVAMSDAAIEGAFSALIIDAKPSDGVVPVGSPVNVSDAAKQASDAFEKSISDMNAWRNN